MAPSSSSTPSSTTAITLACSIHHRLRSAWERIKTRDSHHHHHHHMKPSLPVSTNVVIVRTIIYSSNHFGLQYSSSSPLGLGKKKYSRLASSSSSSSHEALITGIYKRRHRPHHHLQHQSLWPAVFIIGSTQLRKEVKTIIIIIT
jgi:hypothetical protein